MAATKRRRFQLTSLSTEEKKRLAGYIKELGGTFIDTQIFAKQVTHVVCGTPNRGEKYLGGCALGKWVLQKEFIEDSYKQGRWLSEEKYEWTSSLLGADSPKQLALLYDAPKKWRTGLKNSEGAFQHWNTIVHVQDSKLKKAYERLLEAGNATVYKKKISFEDSENLPNDLSHMFVETNRKHDVQHLDSNGTLLYSVDFIPEYIIQVSKEALAASSTMLKYNHDLFNSIVMPHQVKKTTRKNKAVQKTGSMSGQEKDVIVKRKEHSGKRGTKRLATDCDLCLTKRRKNVDTLPPYIGINSTQYYLKGRHLVFPGYVLNILESCVDEDCFDLGMESVASCLSSQHAPTSAWLRVIMNQFLLNAPTEEQAFQSYRLLQNIIEVHPPALYQDLYFEALEEHSDSNSQDVHTKKTAWEFVSKVIRTSLEENQENKEGNRMQCNAVLLMKFFDNLFKLDCCDVRQPSSMITRILWPASADSVCQSNAAIKDFVSLCCEAVRAEVGGGDKSLVCHILLDMLSMAVTLKKRDDVTGQACESLAQLLFVEISKSDNYEATKFLIQGCHSTWLKMRILESVLGNFDKRLIPSEYKQLLNKSLSLNKIVLCYFFLLPNMKGVVNMEAKPAIPKRKRKNGKGETPLHLACIHNNSTKLDRILKEKDADVNAVDNAGWSALHEACNHGHIECVKKILQYHERTNKVNLLASPDNGVTVLHDAVLNNHLAIVKLLAQAGGLELLEAKDLSGMTARQLSKNNEISRFLESELNRLRGSQDLDQNNFRLPLPEVYNKVLTSGKQKQYVPLNDCEKYVFFVSQFVQVYVKEKMLYADLSSMNYCTNCSTDVACWRNFPRHLVKLEQHLKMLTGKRTLTHLCDLYITSMRLCMSHVK